MHKFKIFTLLLMGAMATGCASTDARLPLIFGQSHTVGISIGASTTDQGGELVLGYKDKNIAIVPVTERKADGDYLQIKSSIIDENGQGPDTDALSVLGQFETSGSAGVNPNFSLGKFFATGLAAQKLADGFAAKLGNAGSDGQK